MWNRCCRFWCGYPGTALCPCYLRRLAAMAQHGDGGVPAAAVRVEDESLAGRPPPPPPPRSSDESGAGGGTGGAAAAAAAPRLPAPDAAAAAGRLPVQSTQQSRPAASDAAARAQAQAQAAAAALSQQQQNPSTYVAAACIDHLLGQFVGHLVRGAGVCADEPRITGSRARRTGVCVACAAPRAFPA